MTVYVYCVGDVANQAASVLGIGGARVEALTVGTLTAWFSEFAADIVPLTRENVLAHESVVREALAESTPLPFRFGTLVTREELQKYMSERAGALRNKLVDVHDCVEMSVKIISTTPTQTVGKEAEPASLGEGAAFLLAKKKLLMGAQLRAESAKEISIWLENQLTGCVRESLITLHPTERLVLAAAYLVRNADMTEYRSALAQARKDRPELHFLTSGPWPPYSFANIDLEFENHFGVS